MTALGDTIKRWCQEESLHVVAEQDGGATLAYAVTRPGDPPLAISVRLSAQPGRLTMSHTTHVPLPEEIDRDPKAQQRLAALMERVAASRSALVECRLVEWRGALTAEIATTLHEEGASKQGFLTAVEEIRKVTRVMAWELEAMALTMGMVSEMGARIGSIVERSEALAADAARAVKEFEAPAAVEDAPPPAPPSPPPVPPAAPASVFCANCGQQAKPGARFCRQCGAALEY